MKQSRHHLVALGVIAVGPFGCATYEASPIDPAAVLAELRVVEWAGAPGPANPSADAVGPHDLAAFAVVHNPRLSEVRAELGLRQAMLVEAGLLDDPQIGWDAMDVLAAQIVEGSSSSVDALSGLSLMFPLPRPGERGARIGAAEWREEEARRLIQVAEWALTRDVHVAYEEAWNAAILVQQTAALMELAASTADYFERAAEAGTATAIEVNFARGAYHAIRLDRVRAIAREQAARQELNALLGLPPETRIELGAGEDPSAIEVLQSDPEALTDLAIASRPDLAALLARYQAAEERVRLAVSKQYPLLSLGTGIQLALPLFTKFGRPAVATAVAERAVLAAEFRGAVHAARQDIAAASTLWELARQEVEIVEQDLLPNAERSLELAQDSLEVGAITLLETLAMQRALVEARTRYAEARAERSKRAWILLAFSGQLLRPNQDSASPAANQEISQ